MSKLGPFEVHPFADVFPLIEGDEFDDLVRDIKAHGLRDKIVLNHDRTVLVDGRNRYRACDAADVEADFEVLPKDISESAILDLIVSKNITRRQLSAGQRAFLALEYEKAFEGEAKEAQRESARRAREHANTQVTDGPLIRADPPESAEERLPRTKAARAVGASPRAVQRAKAVQTYAPELVERVRSGEMPLDLADKEAQQRRMGHAGERTVRKARQGDADAAHP